MTSLEKALKVTKAVEQGKELRSQLPVGAEQPSSKVPAPKTEGRKSAGPIVAVAVVLVAGTAGLAWHFLAPHPNPDPVAPAPPVAAAVTAASPAAPTADNPAADPAKPAVPPAASVGAVGPVAPSSAPAVAAGASQPTPELQAVADGLAVGGIALIGGMPRVLINGAICLEGNFPKGVANLRLESVSEHELVFTGPGGEHYRRRF